MLSSENSVDFLFNLLFFQADGSIELVGQTSMGLVCRLSVASFAGCKEVKKPGTFYHMCAVNDGHNMMPVGVVVSCVE